MPERDSEIVTLPRGGRVLELAPFEQSVELALEVARLGVSDEAIRALGGDEALRIVHELREHEAVSTSNGGNGTGEHEAAA